jgi:predicted nucleic acid-binding protein
MCSISLITIATINQALAISQRYKYSYFDSLILACAIENSCSTLYSEDMHNKHVVNESLIILNPFV